MTGCVRVRKRSKGIDFFIVGPRSLRMRMWIGFWPPSKRTRLRKPEREPAPLWPRPDVLPEPEPSPRPTRLRVLARAPGGAERVQPEAIACQPSSTSTRWRTESISPRTVA